MTQRSILQHDRLDEIAGLLAQGYLRLREKRAQVNTRGQQSRNEREISLADRREFSR